jgi:hypothetical protein
VLDDYPTNADRAAWAAAATAAFGRLTGQDDPSYLVDPEAIAEIAGDLICDLLHFVNVAGGDPVTVTYNAIGHFEYEAAEEADEAATQLEARTLPMVLVDGIAYPARYELTAVDYALHGQAATCLSALNRRGWWERAAGAVATWWNCAAYRLTGRKPT